VGRVRHLRSTVPQKRKEMAVTASRIEVWPRWEKTIHTSTTQGNGWNSPKVTSVGMSVKISRGGGDKKHRIVVGRPISFYLGEAYIKDVSPTKLLITLGGKYPEKEKAMRQNKISVGGVSPPDVTKLARPVQKNLRGDPSPNPQSQHLIFGENNQRGDEESPPTRVLVPHEG